MSSGLYRNTYFLGSTRYFWISIQDARVYTTISGCSDERPNFQDARPSARDLHLDRQIALESKEQTLLVESRYSSKSYSERIPNEKSIPAPRLSRRGSSMLAVSRQGRGSHKRFRNRLHEAVRSMINEEVARTGFSAVRLAAGTRSNQKVFTPRPRNTDRARRGERERERESRGEKGV